MAISALSSVARSPQLMRKPLGGVPIQFVKLFPKLKFLSESIYLNYPRGGKIFDVPVLFVYILSRSNALTIYAALIKVPAQFTKGAIA